MNAGRYVPVLVLAMGALVAVAVFINFAISDGPDHADLVPAPDSIVWEEGDETIVWLSTNRRDVDLRIDSVSLGFGDIRRIFPEAGESMTLGRAEGCQDWAVSLLEPHDPLNTIQDDEFIVHVEIDRNGYDLPVEVHLRYRLFGATTWVTAMSSDGVSDKDLHLAGTESDFEYRIEPGAAAKGVYEVQASSSVKFPEPIARSITVDMYDKTGTTDAKAEAILMVEDTGVGLVACDEHDGVVVTLHGNEGEELNRYLLDIVARPASATGGPSPDASYVSRRVCVDAADDQENYLSGGEEVGGPFDAADFGLDGGIQSAELIDVLDGNDYRYFVNYSLSSGSIQLSVSDPGASVFGLDSDRIYPVRLTATDDSGTDDDPNTPGNEFVPDATAHLDVGVWLDTSTLSPGDDGSCR